MQRGLPLDAIDSQVVLRVFGWVTLGLGAVTSLWGLHLIRWGLPHTRMTEADAVFAMAGAAQAGAALLALALSRLTEPMDQRRCLYWLAVGHSMVLAVAFLLWMTSIPPMRLQPLHGPLSWAASGLAGSFLWLWYGYSRQGGDVPPLGTYLGLFGPRPMSPTQTLRSQYEQRTRLAGAREERHRLARELHDSIKQQIFAVQTAAATAEARFSSDPEGSRSAMAQVRSAARDSMAEMDALLDQLQTTPLDNAGLVDALKGQCEALRLRTGADVVCQIGPLPVSELLQPGVHMALFRVAQEALSNVARHARATRVRVSLERCGNTVTLAVADNGAGYVFASGASGMGLQNIKARVEEFGGEVHLRSHLGDGTTVEVTMPLPDADAAYYLKRAGWATGAALFVVLLSIHAWSRGRGSSFGIMAAPMSFEAVRYVVAWRRATRLHTRLA